MTYIALLYKLSKGIDKVMKKHQQTNEILSYVQTHGFQMREDVLRVSSMLLDWRD